MGHVTPRTSSWFEGHAPGAGRNDWTAMQGIILQVRLARQPAGMRNRENRFWRQLAGVYPEARRGRASAGRYSDRNAATSRSNFSDSSA